MLRKPITNIRNARFNTTSTPKPVIIVTPTQESHVQDSVLCSKQSGIRIRIRSGGHDYEGVSYVSQEPYIILNMFNLRSVAVDMKEQTAWKSKVHGFPSAVCPTVGVGGNLCDGGYGFMLRKYGTTVDNVLDAKMVDVNGRILDRNSMGEDLFWGIRGGGGGASFGVILAYKINLVAVPPKVTVFRVERTLEESATDIVSRWQHNGEMTIRASIVALFLSTTDDIVALLGKEFPELGLKKEDTMVMSWIESIVWVYNGNVTSPNVLLNREPNSATFGKRKSDYVQTPIPKDGLEGLWKRMIEIGETGLAFNPYGGKMSQIPASVKDGGIEAENNFTAQAKNLYSYMTPFVSKNPRSAFLNYRDLDIGIKYHGNNSYEEGKVYGTMYFHENFDRLVKVKTEVDPENFFRNEQSIPPLPRNA
ncbi:hypothetical protein CIPAW_09G143400 [Carya illinoinensis]|uniref:FAD-binding PCMH-type domain-containing protein n=1 Tax=Carya illinoinensis TaxID=32201 RepID=A0A8T1PQ99_CARIL|nr:hypothetical protein CIPAW_09G143400 [Carya illinoinensis]